MRKISIQFFILGVLAMFLASCSTDKFSGFETAENGVKYRIHYRGNNDKPSHDSDWMKVNMDYRLTDTVLFSSKMLDKEFIFPMIKPMFEGDLYEGIKMMGEGDSMTFAIVADSFFMITANMPELPDYVEPGEPMYFDVKLLERFTNEEYKAVLEQRKAEQRHKESFKLKAYLNKNGITNKALPSGLIFIPIKEGYGKKPDTGEMCRVYLKVEILDGDMLYSNFNGEPIDVEYGKNFDTKGFMEGLGMLKVGEKARLIVPSSIGVGEAGKETVPPFTTIIYEVELDKIRSVEEVQKERAEKKKVRETETAMLKENEPERIEKYITDNNIEQIPTASGLYVINLYQGNGEKPVNGDVVRMHYTLFTIDGEKVDSSYDTGQPIEITLGRGQVIEGWEEAIPLMEVGSKTRLIIPSSLAYGRGTKGKIVAPYSPLVFEIELLEIVNR